MQTGARISFGVYDETAKPDASVSLSGAMGWADGTTMVDESSAAVNYMTGEPGRSLLDGSFRLFPNAPNPQNMLSVWSGALSGEDGALSPPLIVTIAFTQLHSSVGITLHGDPTADIADATVKWYGTDGGLLATAETTANTEADFFVDEKVDGYQKVVLTVTATAEPRRYARLTEVDFGQLMVFGDADLVSASFVEETDLSGASLPDAELNFTVLNRDQRFNILNPDGIYAYLRENMRLTVEAIQDGTPYPAGTYYLSKWASSSGSTAKMSAIGEAGVLAKQSVPIDLFVDESLQDGTERFIGADAPVHIDAALKAAQLQGTVKAGDKREVFSQMVMAAGGIGVPDRTGGLRVREIGSGGDVLTVSDVLGTPAAEQREQITQLEIDYYRYTVGQNEIGFFVSQGVAVGPDWQYIRMDYREELKENTHVLTDVGIDGVMSPAVIEQRSALYGVNMAYVELRADLVEGPLAVTLSGKPLGAVKDTRYTALSELPGTTMSIAEIGLINENNIDAVQDRLTAHADRRLTLTFRAVFRPGWQCGDRITLPTGKGTVTGHIQSIDVDLTGGHIAKVEVVA